MIKNKLFTILFVPLLILGASNNIKNNQQIKNEEIIIESISNLKQLENKTNRLDSLLKELDKYEKIKKHIK
jgi:hypothetical protein